MGYSVAEIPSKSSIYGTLIGLINSKNNGIAHQLVKRFMNDLQEYFDKGDHAKIKVMVSNFFLKVCSCKGLLFYLLKIKKIK